ncbi:MAG: hypothetical protein ACJ71A_06465 [Nitrososphaeraceae archaeon]
MMATSSIHPFIHHPFNIHSLFDPTSRSPIFGAAAAAATAIIDQLKL